MVVLTVYTAVHGEWSVGANIGAVMREHRASLSTSLN